MTQPTKRAISAAKRAAVSVDWQTNVAQPLLLGDLAGIPTDSIRQQRVNTHARYAPPRSVYMIYMRFDDQGQFIVKQLQERDFPDTLAAAEARLLATARGNVPTGINFRDIVWRRPSYLTFVIDNPKWQIHWGVDGTADPLNFLHHKEGSGDIYLTDNFSFFDARPVRGLGAGDAFRCINYHLAEDGFAVRQGDPKKYCFQILLQSPFATSNNAQTHIVIIIDPDGQNQGPRT